MSLGLSGCTEHIDGKLLALDQCDMSLVYCTAPGWEVSLREEWLG
jgi:hypothetical protein